MEVAICLSSQIKLTAQEEVALELGASQVCNSSIALFLVFNIIL